MLAALLDMHGFKCSYDFIYIPHNFKHKKSFGYAFINFVDETIAETFLAEFAGFADWGMESDRIAEVAWAEHFQGLVAHVERYRNSPGMHTSVPDQFKPAIFQHGLRVPFPAPTKCLKSPRM